VEPEILGAQATATIAGISVLPSETASHWYVAYTCSNHEKCVAEQLERRAIEHFLPLYETVRKWKDRRKRMELPLFPGYIFIRFPLAERLRVLEIPSVVRLIGFNGPPLPLPDNDIWLLRSALQKRLCLEPHPYLTIGRRVRITRGTLAGLEGVLTRKKGLLRLVISIELIHRSAMIEVDSADVEPIR
jgi:transcription antitermination factor NusG